MTGLFSFSSHVCLLTMIKHTFNIVSSSIHNSVDKIWRAKALPVGAFDKQKALV